MSRKTKITSINENPSYPSDTDDSDIIPVRKSKKRIFSSSESDNDFSTHDNSSAEDLLRKPEENIDNFEAECNFPNWSKPIHYFDLFFDSELLSLMVTETNNYAEYSRSFLEPSDLSKLPKWTPVTELELKAFIAMILEMGITRRPSITSYWSKNSRQIPWFKKMFSRNRFQEILKYFHLVDSSLCFPPSHPNYDPCVRFEPLVKHANRVFKLISTKCEEKNVTITKKKHGREWHSTKPAIIHSYNTFMGGVDESDKMLYTYLDERRTVKYWKKVAFNIMNRMVLNAYIIYKKNANNRAMTRLDFISRIIFYIGREWMKEKRVRVFQRDFLDENRLRLVKLPQRNLRNCVVCSTKNKRKRSHLICVQCEKGVHPTCYHKHQCFT
ncbi:uncharacterized protein LOC122404327 [Colletes gigas]|uniref:uncharacterized protein LOC122404327 n=1 Tax=Colletes gigas TaxID=935657 RepID=UPI001C9B4E5F|nr:uncharacterized protein LOC122404327 [Colletes gigas]